MLISDPNLGPSLAKARDVTIRILQLGDETGLVLRVVGWLDAHDVPELARVLEEAAPAVVALDLSELRGGCKQGLSTLRSFRERGIELRSAVPFVALQLDHETPDRMVEAEPG